MNTISARHDAMEPLGPKIRRQRRRLGLTLDELAGRTSISKPYLSLIETGRVMNPPSDEKLRRLEQSLGFSAGELLTQAHLLRTPKDVREMLHQLMAEDSGFRVVGSSVGQGTQRQSDEGTKSREENTIKGPLELNHSARSSVRPAVSFSPALDPLLTGVLREMAQRHPYTANAVPVINRPATDYPRDFADLSYPARVADEFVSCPDLTDPNAFAARVSDDAMTSKYHPADIVIFSPALAARDGDDCFIRFANGQSTFRRVFFENNADNDPQLRLQPRNERFRAQVVSADQVSGMHKAVFQYQRVD